MVYYHFPPPPPPPTSSSTRLMRPPSPPPRYQERLSAQHGDANRKTDKDLLYRRITLHGLSDLHRANNRYLRWFWLITFFGALAAAVYGSYHILELYLKSPVVVSYFVQEFDSSFPLPDLVICPFNRFNAEFLRNYSIPDDVAQYMQLTFGASAKHPNQRSELVKYINPELMPKLEMRMNETLQRMNMTFGDFLEAASLRCEDIFVDCYMPDGAVNCCDYATSMMTFAGKCYRIRGVNQMGPGYGFGMSIVISLPKKLYSLAINNWLNDGIVTKLVEPHQGVDYDLTFVPTGTHALMPLKAIKYEFMNDPPRFECIQNPSPNYSRVDCFDACFIETAQNTCKCTIVTNFKRNLFPACTTYEYYFCIYRVLIDQFRATNITMETYFYACRQRCKPKCEYWQYSTSVSYSNFPSQEARAFAKTPEEWTKMENTIIMDLYYEKLEFVRIRHYRSMTLHAFIANLGGQLSLWLGASVITLIQLIVFITQYSYDRCRRAVDDRKLMAMTKSAIIVPPQPPPTNSVTKNAIGSDHHHHHHSGMISHVINYGSGRAIGEITDQSMVPAVNSTYAMISGANGRLANAGGVHSGRSMPYGISSLPNISGAADGFVDRGIPVVTETQETPRRRGILKTTSRFGDLNNGSTSFH